MEIINKIKQSKNIALFAHTNADPDSLGSVCATSLALSQMGKNCSVFLCEQLPEKFGFLKFDKIKYEMDDKNYDLLISLDVSDSKRLGQYEKFFTSHSNTIAVDHHGVRTPFGKLELVDTTTTSNVEILLNLFEEMNLEITKDIANALYLGLVGDTGRFMHSNTNPKAHINASKLIEAGAEYSKINTIVFATRTLKDLKIMQIVIDRIEIRGNIAISYYTDKDKKTLEEENFDSSELVNLLRSIKGVDVAVLVKQKQGKNYGISLRSSEKIDVSAFASKFGGGGHKRASGMSLVGTVPHIKKILFEELDKFAKGI